MTVTQHLVALETSGLIRLAPLEPGLEYLFRHALIQDAANESMLKADRKQLHRVIGETQERLYATQLNDIAPALARHFHESGDVDRARELLHESLALFEAMNVPKYADL